MKNIYLLTVQSFGNKDIKRHTGTNITFSNTQASVLPFITELCRSNPNCQKHIENIFTKQILDETIF